MPGLLNGIISLTGLALIVAVGIAQFIRFIQ
jgi:hypothetical protein